MMRDFLLDLADGILGGVLTAEAERETEGERDGNDKTGKECLDKSTGHADLGKRDENGENPDAPLGDRAEKVGRVQTGCAA